MKPLFLVLLGLIFINCFAQKEKWSHGLSYGCGVNYTNQDYNHDNYYLRGHFYYTPKQKSNSFNWQLAIEPEVNDSRHKDFNQWFMNTKSNDSRRIEMREYSITFGIIARQYFGNNDKWSIYGMIGTGPVFLDEDTNRVSKGLAFTNTLATGISYRIKKTYFELRPSLRHISNAGMNNPNRGIDTANIELGVFLPFLKNK